MISPKDNLNKYNEGMIAYTPKQSMTACLNKDIDYSSNGKIIPKGTRFHIAYICKPDESCGKAHCMNALGLFFIEPEDLDEVVADESKTS